MMKPGPNFRMSRAGKTYLAVTWNRPNRRARRASVIQAELYGSAVVKSRKERDS